MTEEAERQGVEVAAPAEAPSVGEILSRARCAVGLSVEDVALQLKFKARQIDALEKGRYDELHEVTFARGLVRNYARLLKLDPEPLLRRIAGSLAAPAAIDDSVPFRKPIPFSNSARRVNLGYALLSLAVLAVMAAVVFGWPGERGAGSKLTFVPAGEAPIAKPASPVQSAPQHVPIAAVGTPLASIAPEHAAPESEARAPAAPVAAAARNPITLRFDKPSWVEVRGGDGRILTSQLNAAGTTLRVDGAPPFSLVIGNAQHVHLSYGEQPIDLSRYARLDVARLTLE
jgi:cytoskeleton protein RodZ